MARDLNDDAYIAELLKEDAKKATKTYELVGIDAFNPRMKSRAPRPNKGFLQHLIRQTDSHNSALLAKEAAESRARLRMMDREKRQAAEQGDAWAPSRRDVESAGNQGRLAPSGSDVDRCEAESSRRQDRSKDEDRHTRKRRELAAALSNPISRRHRDRSRDGHRHKRRHDSEDEDHSKRKRRRSKSPRDRSRKDKYGKEQERYKPRGRDHKDREHARRTSHSRIPSRSRSRSPHSSKHRKHSRHRDRTRSLSPKRKSATSKPPKPSRHPTKRSPSPASSSSDPLEAIVGPLPPPRSPPVRSKGRNAYKPQNGGIESRFSSTYDPTTDVRPASDVEDDWGDALEALRDRARWQQQGADRLKQAGFTDDQVRKWERGDVQGEEDVVWRKKGEGREWDRGKVVDEEGDVEVRADFGRLK
ncbi:uncharacterized protein J4E78_009017 [Alternaria triticimaculans]|uniref:uncharacterized protein n=1 Tax=Alternaria triticimaculans TaxID=297637 RepID=UPI0020C53C29|nr:uncharacterized protein J4E78_009017 [Alternaria triticimaculans]KAI4647045.1 hypothetical protein J4E78_009017 [Alternaria triticimaculans]